MDKNNALIDLSESNRIDYGRVDFSEQTHEQRIFSAVWALESRVNSGGFESFIEYEDPALVTFSPQALRTIGASNCAEIVQRALSAGSDALEDLDSEFYTYPDDLTEMLYTYVSTHPAVFGHMPSGT